MVLARPTCQTLHFGLLVGRVVGLGRFHISVWLSRSLLCGWLLLGTRVLLGGICMLQHPTRLVSSTCWCGLLVGVLDHLSGECACCQVVYVPRASDYCLGRVSYCAMHDSEPEGVVDGLLAARAHIIWVWVLQAHSFLQVGGAEQ